MRFAVASVELGLPFWYGWASIGLWITSTITWMVTGMNVEWKPASNVLVMLCNMNAIFLIYVLQARTSGTDDTTEDDDQGSNSQSSYKQDTSTPSDSEDDTAKDDSMFDDSIFGEPLQPPHRRAWQLQLLLTVLLSAMVFWDAYTETHHYYLSLQGLFSTADWHRSLFLLSNGAFLACLLLHILRRKFSDSLLVPTVVATLLSVVCLAFAVWILTAHRLAELNPMQQVVAFDSQSRSGNQITSFQGDAHVRGVALLDNRPCASPRDALRVQLDVQWGGSWGCPNVPSTYCEASIESIVSCSFWNSGRDASDSSVNEFDEDPFEYVLMRYDGSDNMGSFDDDAFDIDEEPEQSYYWNHPSETIVGNCENCEAMSWPMIMMNFHQVTRTLHQGFLSLGAGIFGVAWLVTILVQNQRHRAATKAASNAGGRTAPLV